MTHLDTLFGTFALLDSLTTLLYLTSSRPLPQVVKLFGIVNSKQEFTEQHLVLNGASDLMMEVPG